MQEPQPGHFDFTGQNDTAEFIREAQAEGFNVILRPGPYRGYSVNLYVFDGGTTFSWMNGAESHTGTGYHPDHKL